MKFIHTKEEWGGIVKAFGLVFGDIGTSPIYTLTVIFLLIEATPFNIIGIVSLIIWTLVIIVFLEYVILAMSLDVHGEGGSLILRRIIDDVAKSKKAKTVFAVMAFIEVSLVMGDGVITPSISILSAVEGIELIPGFHAVPQYILVIIAMVIAVGLFVFQSKGTDKVATTFGPLMLIWFSSLAVSGAVAISSAPVILNALNPLNGFMFLLHYKIAGFFILAQVILCATGAEAMYADMGHLGRKPILRAWRFVFVALILTYLGQGAFLLTHPGAKNILFAMISSEFNPGYIPFLLLTIAATVIASQALISGVFSIVYQGISINAFPRMKIDFTSNKLKSQIYIDTVNWMLLIAVLFMLMLFKRSDRLAVAYGLAVTGSMFITGIMMSAIFYLKKKPVLFMTAVFVTCVDLVFFAANFIKIPYGGYWSIILATIPFSVIMLWTKGQRRIYKNLRSLDIETFLPGYSQIYAKGKNIPGCAIFFVGSPRSVSPYIIHCIAQSNIIYEKNIFITVNRTEYPFGIEIRHNENLGPGLQSLEILAGYKEEVDIGHLISTQGITPKIIFYGIEDIHTKNFFWGIFAILKHLSPSFVKFYKVPATKLHGVVSRVEI